MTIVFLIEKKNKMHYIKGVLQRESVAPRRMCGVMNYPGLLLVYEWAISWSLGLKYI